ncbi:MAG: TraR/DksA family transcriptional regulator [Planctomycetota bacterium]|jgi:DnaK suppressor protein
MGIKGTNGQKLSASEIRSLHILLLSKRNEIVGNVTEMESEALHKERTDLSNVPFHMADAASDNYEIENALGLMESERKILVEIDDALRRVEDGNYGICEGAGEFIPKKRLHAIPWARYCINCATLLEKGLLPEKAEE